GAGFPDADLVAQVEEHLAPDVSAPPDAQIPKIVPHLVKRQARTERHRLGVNPGAEADEHLLRLVGRVALGEIPHDIADATSDEEELGIWILLHRPQPIANIA